MTDTCARCNATFSAGRAAMTHSLCPLCEATIGEWLSAATKPRPDLYHPRLGEWVTTPHAPGMDVRAMVVASFLYGEPETNYVLAYKAGEQTCFLVRVAGQMREANDGRSV